MTNSKTGTNLLLAAALLVSFAIAPPLSAQNAQGTILGHVTDPTGSVVTKASVTITNVNTGIKQSILTSDVGDYVFVNVVPGVYDILVEAKGFKAARVQGLTLQVDHTLRQNFNLEVGALVEQVTVQAEAALVQSDNASLGSVVSEKLLSELPLSGRDFTNLIKVQAGATIMGGGPSWAWTMHGLNNDYQATSVNGARPESIGFLVDGVSSNDQFFSAPSNLPNSYAVTEFKVQNGLYSAEYGQGAAQVNVALRSGSNQYHGDAYDYLQNDAFQPENPLNKFLNSSNPGSEPLPLKNVLRQNQFGFTLGGPVMIPKLYNGRNRSFWFFSYDLGRQRQRTTSRAVVPTLQERTGNFSDWPWPIYDPATTGSVPATADNPSGRTPFPGNQIPSNRFNPIAQSILKYIPEPTVTCALPCTSGGNAQTSLARPYNSDTISIRGDQNFSDRDRVFFTGVIGDQKFANPSLMPLTGETKYTRNRLYGLNYQHTFTPNIFNEARFGYTSMHFQNGSETAFGPDIASALGFQNVPNVPAFFGPPVMGFNGYQTLGNGNSGWSQNNYSYQAVENLKIIHGKHTFTVGADIRRIQADLLNGYGAMGSLNFTGAYTASNPANAGSGLGPGLGNSMADLLLGYPQSVGSPSPVPGDVYDLRATNWNFFIQDDFRISPRLTLNLGFRYEIPPTFHSITNGGITLDPSNGGGFKWVDKKFVDAALQQPGVNPNFLRCCAGDTLIPADHKDFAPRIGLAWRPLATDRFVIRAGYGIFYDIYSRYYELSTYDDAYIYAAPTVNYLPGSGSETASPLALNSLWQPFPSSSADYSLFTLPSWRLGLQVNWPDNRQPRTQQWTLGVQYQLSTNTLLDVSYVGSRAQHQNGYWYYNAGRAPAVPDPCNVWRSAEEAASQQPSCLGNPNFQPVNTRNDFPNVGVRSYANANIFWSTYHSLQARMNRRFDNGFQYNLNYTWSKALDLLSVIGLQYGANSFIQDPHNIRGEYGPASFDQTHRFVMNGSYEVPIGKGKRLDLGALNHVIGGWQVSGIYSLSSGLPYTIYAYNDDRDQLGLTRLGSVRANLVGDPDAGHHDIFQLFNTAAFAQPEIGRFGNLGRGTLRSPYYTRGDISFGKNFRIGERHRVKYSLDIFNVGSTWHSNLDKIFPRNTIAASPVGCTPGPSGNCAFGSQVDLNGGGDLNLWTPRVIQMNLAYSF